jgi:hypothetical protein
LDKPNFVGIVATEDNASFFWHKEYQLTASGVFSGAMPIANVTYAIALVL